MARKRRALKQNGSLAEPLEKRLAAYALAAGAAGVGLLALEPAAKADIIPTTSAVSWDSSTAVLLPGVSNWTEQIGVGDGLFINLHVHTGGGGCISDVCIPHTQTVSAKLAGGRFSIGGFRLIELSNNGGLLGEGVPVRGMATLSLKLGKGSGDSGAIDSIGVGGEVGVSLLRNFQICTRVVLEGGCRVSLQKSGYIGFAAGHFLPSFGVTQTGWAKINMDVFGTVTNVFHKINGFRPDVNGSIGPIYEGTCGGQPILTGQTSCGPTPLPTPEPSTLSLLALGAVGMFALRRKKRAVQRTENE